MHEPHRVAVIHPDGEIVIADFPIVDSGPDATTLIDVEGLAYDVYHFNVQISSVVRHGYVASPTAPTAEERNRVARMVYGPQALPLGVLESIQSANRELSDVSHGHRHLIRETAPDQIVIAFPFRDGTVEDISGERSTESSVLALFPRAVCAYRFFRPSTNRFLPWIPIAIRDLINVRGALIHRLEMLSEGNGEQAVSGGRLAVSA
jgi:hypothetical protein